MADDHKPLKTIAFETLPGGQVTCETLIDEASGRVWAIAHVLADDVYLPVMLTADGQGIKPLVTDRGVPVFADAPGARAFLAAWNAGDRSWPSDLPETRVSVRNGRIVRGE